MSACLEMCLDSECTSLNPLALFKAFYLNILFRKACFFTAVFLQSSSYLEGCVCVLLFPSFSPGGEEESLLTPE